jgi:PIN domain nuclease of toxin-antitoxin system
MRLLVDTCTFLWLAADSDELSSRAKAACVDPSHHVFLSAISAWEISIKNHLGRLNLPAPAAGFVASRREFLQLTPLPFDEAAAAHTSVLPAHHRDPFDRALVSQAILHGLTIVTPDAEVARYPAPTLW